MPAQKELCAKCNAIIDPRIDGYGSDPEKGVLCTDCWQQAHDVQQDSISESLDIQDLGYTPGPWTVDRTDDYGSYRVQKAAREQNQWVEEGYDISDEEGERRNDIAELHDDGNRRLIQAAPDMLAACKLALSGKADDDTILNALAEAVAKAEG